MRRHLAGSFVGSPGMDCAAVPLGNLTAPPRRISAVPETQGGSMVTTRLFRGVALALLAAAGSLLIVSSGAATQAKPAAGGALLKLHTTSLGRVLVDGRGMTLYLF